MDYQDNNFHFYNSENDGYRGGLGGYTDGAQNTPPQQQPKKSSPFSRRAVALVLTCALVGGGAGLGGAALYDGLTGPGPAVIYESGRTPAEIMANTNGGKEMTPDQLYAANLPSCVGITVSTTVNVFGQTTTSAASGSGFVITDNGYIITNHHVIEAATADGSVPITVTFHDGTSYPATLVGYEADNDVAVLKIVASGLTPATLGDSDKIVVGQTVMAIGNPLGELTYSLTDGLVSALDRLITTQDGATMNMLQTNCAINPGNSGGPLFNSFGEVIGITTAKYSTSSSGTTVEGLGFAIPINDVKSIVTDLIEHGYVTGKPYLGIRVSNVPTAAQQYGVAAGAAVESVSTGSCSEKAGLKAGDIITAIDDTAVDSSSALTAALSSYRAGDTAKLTVVRAQETLTLTITFDEKNDTTEAANQQTQQETQQQEQQQYPSGGYSQWPFGSFYGW